MRCPEDAARAAAAIFFGKCARQDGGWQACCMILGMSDHAYDISYLLESEMTTVEVPIARVQKAPPARPLPSPVAAAQEAMARELLQAATAHEALIEQYLRTAAVSPSGESLW